MFGGGSSADESAAFCPGHVTGFFGPHQEGDDPDAHGSVGAGFSVELGVTSRVRIEGDQVVVRVNGQQQPADTTRAALRRIIEESPRPVPGVVVEQAQDLPDGQGFGMSAAGATSAALALGTMVGLEPRRILDAPHEAEIEQKTGLGDVAGASLGGFEMRLKPGIPPYGEAKRFSEDQTPRVVLAVVDPPVSTADVLSRASVQKSLRTSGHVALASLRSDASPATFCAQSRRFALACQLVGPEARRILEADKDALAGACLLGGSVFAFEPEEEWMELLPEDAKVFQTRVSGRGAHVVHG